MLEGILFPGARIQETYDLIEARPVLAIPASHELP